MTNKQLDIVLDPKDPQYLTIDGIEFVYNAYNRILHGTNSGRLLMYAISELQGNESHFVINNYLSSRGYTQDAVGKNDLIDEILSLSRMNTICAIKDRENRHRILLDMEIDGDYVHTKFNPDLIGYIKSLYAWIPTPLYNEHKNKWSVWYYLYSMIVRQKHMSYQIVIPIRNIIVNSNYNQYISEEVGVLYVAVNDTFDYINKLQDIIEIQKLEYSDNFLNENLTINVDYIRI